MMDLAIKHTQQADFFIVVGTSLVVYPAASLLSFVDNHIPKYIIDPNLPALDHIPNLHYFPKPATQGLTVVCDVIRSSNLRKI